MNRSTALIILAAGESKRLGQPKQQLVFRGKSLLQRAIDAGLHSDCTPVLVILGAHLPDLLPEIHRDQVEFIINDRWKKGMASSIQVGIKKLMATALPDQIILMLCDQPYADEQLLNQLIEAQQKTGKPIVASAYKNTLGAPVLLDQKFFPHLLHLNGQEGAKKLLFQYADEVTEIPFPLGHIDIDTPSDYKSLLGGGTGDK